MGPILMIAKSNEDEKVFKDKDGNLIPFSRLTDKQLIEAVKFAEKRANECYKMHESLLKKAEQLRTKSLRFTELLDSLEEEVNVRKEAIENKLKELTIN
jgi:hypothetical protein